MMVSMNHGAELDGYAADIPYLRDFKPMLAPAWLDHVALVGRDRAARRGRMVLPGAISAAARGSPPRSSPRPILPANSTASMRCRCTSIMPAGWRPPQRSRTCSFHAVDFAAAIDLQLPSFDYIVAHGVYTWIDREAQRALRRFYRPPSQTGRPRLSQLQRDAGLGARSAVPGLLRELGRTFTGGDSARLAAAAELARTLAGAGVRHWRRASSSRNCRSGRRTIRRPISSTSSCPRHGGRSTSPRSEETWRRSASSRSAPQH